MSVYYAFLWIISVLQLLRFAVQVGEGASHATLWNLSWLLTRFGASVSGHGHMCATLFAQNTFTCVTASSWDTHRCRPQRSCLVAKK